MSRSPNKTLIRLITAVTLLVSLLGPLVTSPQIALADDVGDLTIRKVTSESSNQNFAFTATRDGQQLGSGNGSFNLQNGGTRTWEMDTGSSDRSRTYVVTEAAVAGWTLTGITCTGQSGNFTVTTDVSNRKVTIVTPGNRNQARDITCTFTNTKDTVTPPTEPGLSPLVVNETLQPGANVDIAKLVTPPDSPPGKLDVLFLSDTTGSMQPTIDNVKANATGIMNAVRAQVPDSQFGVAAYRDDYDSQNPNSNYYFYVQQAITSNISLVQTNGVDRLAARALGQDVPEGQINALYQIGAGGPSGQNWVGFRTDPDVVKVVVWFGDATGHDPTPRSGRTQYSNSLWGGQHTEADAIAAL